VAAYAQLSLARGLVADRRLPWERPLSTGSLTPTKVLRNFTSLLPLLGTPAEALPGHEKGGIDAITVTNLGGF